VGDVDIGENPAAFVLLIAMDNYLNGKESTLRLPAPEHRSHLEVAKRHAIDIASAPADLARSNGSNHISQYDLRVALRNHNLSVEFCSAS